MKSKQKDAYLLISSFEGASTYTVDFPSKSPQSAVPLHINLANPHMYNTDSMKIHMKVVKPGEREVHNLHTQLSVSGMKGKYLAQLQGMNEPGLYNITLEIDGITKEGAPYQRTIIQSVQVGDPLAVR
jgi:subtilase family serine protease